MTVKIEVIAAPGCQKCAGAQAELRAVAVSVLGEERWRLESVSLWLKPPQYPGSAAAPLPAATQQQEQQG